MPWPATLLVLAGGESRRMGQSKALLPVGGTTMIEWLIGRIAPSFDHLLISARSAENLPPALRQYLVSDRHMGAGPLAGIEAGLAACRTDALAALACDMPNVTDRLLRRLLDAVEGYDAAVPRVAGRPEPTCAAYRGTAAPVIAAAVGTGRRRAVDVLAELDVTWIDNEDPALFANLNTPQEYRAFLDALRKTG